MKTQRIMNIYVTFLSLLFLGSIPIVQAMVVPQFALKVVEYGVIGGTTNTLLATTKNIIFPDNKPDNNKNQEKKDLITIGLEEMQKENDKEIGFTSTIKSLVSSVAHPNKWLFAAFFCPQHIPVYMASSFSYEIIRQLMRATTNFDLNDFNTTFMRKLCTRYSQFDVIDWSKNLARRVLEENPDNESIKSKLELLNRFYPDDNKSLRYKILGNSLHLFLFLPIFLKCILPTYSKYFHKYAPQKAGQIKYHVMPISDFFNENRHKLFFAAIGSQLLLFMLSLMINK